MTNPNQTTPATSSPAPQSDQFRHHFEAWLADTTAPEAALNADGLASQLTANFPNTAFFSLTAKAFADTPEATPATSPELPAQIHVLAFPDNSIALLIITTEASPSPNEIFLAAVPPIPHRESFLDFLLAALEPFLDGRLDFDYFRSFLTQLINEAATIAWSNLDAAEASHFTTSGQTNLH